MKSHSDINSLRRCLRLVTANDVLRFYSDKPGQVEGEYQEETLKRSTLSPINVSSSFDSATSRLD
jgi:hypothetical protein